MDDPAVRDVVDEGPLFTGDRGSVVVDVDVAAPGELPLSRARNLGAATALRSGADLVVFLDVDCLADPALLSRYGEAAERLAGHAAAPVLSGPVAYLPPLDDGRTSYPASVLAGTPPHPARPAPAPGELLPADDLRLFWSLSFAVPARAWARFGGFDEWYTGYGGEDTDFAQRVAAAGGRLWWVGGALAYHQWHPVSAPPVEHLHQIVRNANGFHRRWGWFPMEGWLEAFREAGLARYDADREQWLVEAGTGAREPVPGLA
jgi:N-acetylglucosaminyl-diphospho-decaprenol L-rhamnosyltransferase